jgi:multimeric flavodoxin WrbA
MDILAICGSPRKGNCERMVEELLRGGEEGGARAELVLLRNLEFSDCCGKDSCFHQGQCHLKDGLTPVLEKLDRARIVVFAAPSYFNNVPGLMKRFMDRTNPYCKSKMFNGKKAVLLSVGGAKISSARRCEAVMKDFCGIHGIDVISSISAVAEQPNDIGKDKLEECHSAERGIYRILNLSGVR